MLLNHYIEREGCGYAGFGSRLDPPMSKGDVWNLAKGKRGVSMHRGRLVIEASGGEVTFEDLQLPFDADFVMPAFVAPRHRRRATGCAQRSRRKTGSRA